MSLTANYKKDSLQCDFVMSCVSATMNDMHILAKFN